MRSLKTLAGNRGVPGRNRVLPLTEIGSTKTPNSRFVVLGSGCDRAWLAPHVCGVSGWSGGEPLREPLFAPVAVQGTNCHLCGRAASPRQTKVRGWSPRSGGRTGRLRSSYFARPVSAPIADGRRHQQNDQHYTSGDKEHSPGWNQGRLPIKDGGADADRQHHADKDHAQVPVAHGYASVVRSVPMTPFYEQPPICHLRFRAAMRHAR